MYVFEAKDLINYHCPRWNELPDIDLYVDQVVTILENNLALFVKDKENPIITANMINNYVKTKIIKSPLKKKYDKDQLAHLFVICILKKVISLSDIAEAIRLMKKLYSVEDGYNVFCGEVENALKYTFDISNFQPDINNDENETRELAALRAMAKAFADSIRVDRLLLLRGK